MSKELSQDKEDNQSEDKPQEDEPPKLPLEKEENVPEKTSVVHEDEQVDIEMQEKDTSDQPEDGVRTFCFILCMVVCYLVHLDDSSVKY